MSLETSVQCYSRWTGGAPILVPPQSDNLAIGTFLKFALLVRAEAVRRDGLPLAQRAPEGRRPALGGRGLLLEVHPIGRGGYRDVGAHDWVIQPGKHPFFEAGDLVDADGEDGRQSGGVAVVYELEEP